MSIHDDVLSLVHHLITSPGRTPEQRLEEALRLLGKYRAEQLARELVQQGGDRIRSGPFAGMAFHASTEGAFVPKLLGCYEADLVPVLDAISERAPEVILNIGCAEGYYAVGLALRLPATRVLAFDIDPAAQAACAELARRNQVADRVSVAGRFDPADFARHAGRRTLVLCDIEGGEAELLDPARAPALTAMDILVETHDVFSPGCTETLRGRFGASHDIEAIPFKASHPLATNELVGRDNLDQLIAVWEWRLPGNDWLWLRSRQPART